MKQKIIIGISILLILSVVYLISRDLFKHDTKISVNPYEYDLNKLKQVDTSLIGYKEVLQFESGLKNIAGISISDNTVIYVSGDHSVTLFDLRGNMKGMFKTDITAQFIAVAGDDVFLGMNDHIEHYKISGSKVKLWKAYNEKSIITSIAINDNKIYLADAGNKIILQYSTDGNLMKEIGRKDTLMNSEGFVIPSRYFDVAFGAFNDLWVANPGKLRIENYSVSGNFQSSWGTPSMAIDGFSGCCNPAHFAILPNGDFVTYEKGLDRIKVYDPTGKFKCVVAASGNFKEKTDFQTGQSNLVKDLTVDGMGNIYVADAYNMIRVYTKK
jgi:hypothetical protein